MAPYYALLLCLHLKIRAQCRVNVVIGQDAIRVRSDTQVIHMHRNFQPTVRGACRNDNDVAFLDVFGDPVSDNEAAAGRAVQRCIDDAVLSEAIAIVNFPSGYQCP